MAFLNTENPAKPAYIHQEYPKHINFSDGKFKVVNDKAEEDIVRAENAHRLPKPKEVVAAEAVNESEAIKKAKASLISIAEKFDIQIDKRWTIERINDAINEVLEAQPKTEEAEKDEE